MSFGDGRFAAPQRLTAFGAFSLAALIALPIFLLFWSLQTRAPLARNAQTQVFRIQAIERDIATLKAQWSEEKAAALETKARANHAAYINSYDELAEWIEAAMERAEAGGFELRFKAGKVRLSPDRINGLNVIHIDLKLARPPSAPPSDGAMYQAVTDFLKRLAEQEKRVDLLSAVIAGDGKRMNQARLTVRLWVTFEDSPETKTTVKRLSAPELDAMEWVTSPKRDPFHPAPAQQ